MRGIEEIYAAFDFARRPAAEEIPDIVSADPERHKIRDLLAAQTAREVPEEELGRYPLYTMFPFLSAIAFRYYMPRFIEFCVKNPRSMLSESLLFSLAERDRAHVEVFLPDERAVIVEYIELIGRSQDAWLDNEAIEKARKLWG